nr:MAG TPA: hypothetical protein [Caudoviricetes sp.]
MLNRKDELYRNRHNMSSRHNINDCQTQLFTFL